MKKANFRTLKESRTKALLAKRRALTKELDWVEAQLETLDPHRLENAKIQDERRRSSE